MNDAFIRDVNELEGSIAKAVSEDLSLDEPLILSILARYRADLLLMLLAATEGGQGEGGDKYGAVETDEGIEIVRPG